MTPDTSSLKPLADDATALLKALAHPVRLTICCQLRDTEMSVGDIESQLGFKQPRLSRELAKLRDEGLVETRRESRVIFYRLTDNPRVRAMIDAICGVMLGKTPAPNVTNTDVFVIIQKLSFFFRMAPVGSHEGPGRAPKVVGASQLGPREPSGKLIRSMGALFWRSWICKR